MKISLLSPKLHCILYPPIEKCIHCLFISNTSRIYALQTRWRWFPGCKKSHERGDWVQEHPQPLACSIVHTSCIPISRGIIVSPSGRFVGFLTFRQMTFRQKHGGGRFGKKNMPKRLRLKTFAESFRMICGAYPVYARSPSPSQRPAPTTIASRSPFSLGLWSCSTLLSKMGI